MKMTIPNDMTLSHMLIQKSKEQNNAYIRLLFVFRGMGIHKCFLMYRFWEAGKWEKAGKGSIFLIYLLCCLNVLSCTYIYF